MILLALLTMELTGRPLLPLAYILHRTDLLGVSGYRVSSRNLESWNLTLFAQLAGGVRA